MPAALSFKVHKNLFELQTGSAHLGWIVTAELKHSGVFSGFGFASTLATHPTPAGHGGYFLFAFIDPNCQAHIKMAELKNVTGMELKGLVDMNPFKKWSVCHDLESKHCIVNLLPLKSTQWLYFKWKLLQCLYLFWYLNEIKDNNRLIVKCSSANVFGLTLHLTIKFTVRQLVWRKKTLNLRRGKAFCICICLLPPNLALRCLRVFRSVFNRLSRGTDYPRQLLYSASVDFPCTCSRHLNKEKKTKLNQYLTINLCDSLSLCPQLYTQGLWMLSLTSLDSGVNMKSTLRRQEKLCWKDRSASYLWYSAEENTQLGKTFCLLAHKNTSDEFILL